MAKGSPAVVPPPEVAFPITPWHHWHQQHVAPWHGGHWYTPAQPPARAELPARADELERLLLVGANKRRTSLHRMREANKTKNVGRRFSPQGGFKVLKVIVTRNRHTYMYFM